MKVLLVEDIDKLGWLGDVVDVKNGYARNYLLPQGLAQPVTEANIKAIADERARRAEIRLAEKARMEKEAGTVNGAEAVIASKANEQGHLFGSVSEKEIAENLRAQGFSVADEIVKLPHHIKEVGTFDVKLKFAPEVTAQVSVVVVAEGAEQAENAEVDGEPQAVAQEDTENTPVADGESEGGSTDKSQ